MTNMTDESMNSFIEAYNKLFNVPSLKADRAICIQYKDEHPNEFKNSDWSIDKHRKRFMDWMSRQNPEKITT
jgi:hypothetical protein